MNDPILLLVGVPLLILGLWGACAPNGVAKWHRGLFGPMEGVLEYYQNPSVIRKISAVEVAVALVLIVTSFVK